MLYNSLLKSKKLKYFQMINIPVLNCNSVLYFDYFWAFGVNLNKYEKQM